MQKLKCILLLTGCFALPLLSRSQDRIAKDSLANLKIEGIDILGHRLLRSNLVKIDHKTLQDIQAHTLGETVSHISGVQNSYFGPFAGAPVIRSLSGNRVKVMSNGLGINDLSGNSPNFNMGIDMDNVESITVHKGSAAVLYGGRAIGGALNVEGRTIPKKMDSVAFNARVQLEGSTNNGFKQAFQAQGNNKKNWAWHVSGSHMKIDKIRIPGNTKPDFVYDPKVIAFDSFLQGMAQLHVDAGHKLNTTIFPYLSQYVLDQFAQGNTDLSEEDKYTFKETYYDRVDQMEKPNPKNDAFIPGQDPEKDRSIAYVNSIADYVKPEKGLIPNSHAQQYTFQAGTSYIRKDFFLGVGYETQFSKYGIPGYWTFHTPQHNHGHAGHTHPVTYLPINMKSISNRLKLASQYQVDQLGLSSIKLDYSGQFGSDRELLDIYQANTFETKRHALRMEIEQQPFHILSGTTGVDFAQADISGKGGLRYMPNSLSRELGLFTMQKLTYRFATLALGYRHDQVKRKAFPDAAYQTGRGMAGGEFRERDFHLNQFSGSMKFNITDIAFLEGHFNHSERAPEVNELYSGNNHFAILIEENGDDRLNKETANGIELNGGLNLKNLKISLGWYNTHYNDYLYLAHTGISRGMNFIVKEWRAADTEIQGFEGDASYILRFGDKKSWEFGGYFDLVKNENRSDDDMRDHYDGAYMPNMPTSRFGLSSKVNYGAIYFYVALDRYLEQRFLGKNLSVEPAMPAYSLLSARISYSGKLMKQKVEYHIAGNNLLNQEARPQNSWLKYVSPLPGANISFGVNVLL